MTLRTLSRGGVALAALLLTAPAAFADYYNTNPTPAERAATERLNNGAAIDAKANADANAAARADFDARQNNYERDRSRFDADRAAYERNRARLERGDAHRWNVFYGYNRFRDIDAMRGRDLIGLRVSTRGGGRIGTVRDVDTNRYGRVTRVAVSVRGGALAWVDTGDLRFDPATRVVYTTLSRDQVEGTGRPRYPRF